MSNKTNEKRKQKKFYAKEWIVILALIVLIIVIVQVKKHISNSSSNEKVENVGVETTESTESTWPSYVQEVETGVKLNTSAELNSNKEIDGILISNIQFTTKNGMSTLLADCTNNNETATEVKSIEVTLLDEDGNSLVALTGVIEPLQPGQTLRLNLSMTSDYIEAWDFTVTEK